MTRHTIATATLAATISEQGAELQSLRDGAGREFLWQAGPEWPRHAPVLFPIVGEVAGGLLRHRGRSYKMGRHGFARDMRFEWVERSATSCRLSLSDSEATRAQFPFAFRFELGYAAEGDTLAVTYSLRNPGTETLPASFGAHPAFRWPLTDGVAKDAHSITFAENEPAPIRRLADNLLTPDPRPTPVRGRTLALREALFADDAVIFDELASRSLRFSAPGTPALDVSWQGFPQLGLWMKPGADFLCIEPWHGTAGPAGFTGDFADKPGVALIPPGGEISASYRVRLVG
jgi:galactose mutarotase-like enzyme